MLLSKPAATAVMLVATLSAASLARAAEPQGAVGQEIFLRYCAACHGLDGRGEGPLANALKKTPPDLTQLAKANGGKFPASRVADTIRDGALPGHGKQTMLEWGKVFGGDKDRLEATSMILDVSLYVESLQAK